jgi:hypothetical protein
MRQSSVTAPTKAVWVPAILTLVLAALLDWRSGLLSMAQAQSEPTYPPITDPNYNLDLFEQPALGSPRLIGMGGAISSVSEGGAGLFTNPASTAVRPETKGSKFAWNVYFNTYIPAKGQDSNNNGQAVTDVRRSLLGAAGLMLQYGKWGLSFDGGYTSHEIAPEAGGVLGVRSLIGHLTLARTFLDDSLAVGLSLRAGGLEVFELDGETLFTRGGLAAEAGVVWIPPDQDFRLALSGGLPVYTGGLQADCDPLDCYGYILPSGAVVPWDMTIGAGWRFGPTPWNHAVDSEFRDELSLTVGLELGIIGAVEDGYGVEAFAAKQLQASGRDPSFTPRLGLEGEIIPGWLRLRAGTYLEAARFEGVDPRLHGTGGAQVRLFAFDLAGSERRVAVSFAGDFASRYQNIGLSIGFWN